jgi:hypothetical protein
MHLGTIFLGARTLTGIGLISDDDLMHQRFVVRAGEERVGDLSGSGGLTLRIQ